MSPNLYCQSSERAFVGCIVQSEGEALDSHRATIEHFTDVSARIAFEAAEGLYKAGSPVTPFTVRQRISTEQMARLGGDHVLADICACPSLRITGHLFEIINGKMMLRRAANAIRWASNEISETQDPSGFCNSFVNRLAQFDSESSTENVLQACLDSVLEKVARIETGTVEYGQKTSLDVWNRAFGGIMKGQMYALAGRPGNGKTAMMEMLMMDMLDHGQPIVVFEKDMSPEKLMERMACRGARVPYWRFLRGVVDSQSLKMIRHAAECLRKAPLFLYNPSNLTPEKLCSIVRRDVRTQGAKAVFLDHIQALRVGPDLREGLTQASLMIRSVVTETNVPHIILAHVNRAGAKGRPSPEDIKEFDQLLGDSDAVVMLWSEKQRADMQPGELMEVNFYVAKNRDGDITDDSLLFDGPKLTFINKSHE